MRDGAPPTTPPTWPGDARSRLRRLPDDLRRYLRAASWPFQGCELCEEEARQAGQPTDGCGPRRSAPCER